MAFKRYSDALPFIQSIDALREAIDDATSAILLKSDADLIKRIPNYELIQPDVVKVVPFTKVEREKVAGFGKDAVVKLIETERGKCVKVSPAPGGKGMPLIKCVGIKDARGRVVKVVKGGKHKLVKVACYKDAACPPPKSCKKVAVPKC